MTTNPHPVPPTEQPSGYSTPPNEPGQPQSVQPSPTDERTWGMLAHLGGLLGIVMTGMFGFVVPLVVMATKGSESAFVRRHAVASLNFQLTLLVVAVLGTITTVVTAILTLGIALLVLIPAAVVYCVFALVVMITASVRSNQGLDYRYPLSIEFVH